MQLRILVQASLKAWIVFQLRISLPEVTGHPSTTSETKVNMSTIPEDYQTLRTYQQSKAGKLADHQPYDLKITLDKGTSPPFGPIYPCPRRNLRLCISSLMRTLLQGSSVPLAPPMGLRFFSSGRKMARLDFASTFRGSIESSRKDSTHFRSFLTS